MASFPLRAARWVAEAGRSVALSARWGAFVLGAGVSFGSGLDPQRSCATERRLGGRSRPFPVIGAPWRADCKATISGRWNYRPTLTPGVFLRVLGEVPNEPIESEQMVVRPRFLPVPDFCPFPPGRLRPVSSPLRPARRAKRKAVQSAIANGLAGCYGFDRRPTPSRHPEPASIPSMITRRGFPTMAEDNSGEERVVLDARTLGSIDPETLARLRSEFGISVELRSNKPGLTAMLDNLTKPGASGTLTGVAAQAAYDRGFDRTNPGYDKFYDRDQALLDPAAAVSNPAVDAAVLNRLIRR